MTIAALVSLVAAWLVGNKWALIVGFIARHVSPTVLAKLEAFWAKVDAAVKAVVAWVKSKV